MPVVVDANVCPLSQNDFGRVAYGVMNHVFALHQELGRFFDEDIYRDALAMRLPGARTEVRIEVHFDDFVKHYFMDLLVEGGAPFELKAVRDLSEMHRSQMLNYLMLSGLSHGKLINLRSESVQHEFVNAHSTLAKRNSFHVDAQRWQEPGISRGPLLEWFVSFVQDIGTGLDLLLYSDAVTHFFGGDAPAVRPVEITDAGRTIGSQKMVVGQFENRNVPDHSRRT